MLPRGLPTTGDDLMATLLSPSSHHNATGAATTGKVERAREGPTEEERWRWRVELGRDVDTIGRCVVTKTGPFTKAHRERSQVEPDE